MISIETYSERGMVLRGDLETARILISETCPKACAQEQRGGLVMSRKYEQAIRDALAVMDAQAQEESDSIPYPLPKRRATASKRASSNPVIAWRRWHAMARYFRTRLEVCLTAMRTRTLVLLGME